MQENQRNKKVTVFYDGSCSLCSREINFYKKRAEKGKFLWVDINHSKSLLSQYNLTLCKANAELHVVDENGKIQKGINGFRIIWRNVPGLSSLSTISGLPIVNGTLSLAYKLFAWARPIFKKEST